MSKERLIQVQKPAQSLERFQQDYARTQAGDGSALRSILVGVGAVAVLGLGYLIFDQWRQSTIEKFEGNLAALVEEVEGGVQPATGEALQKKMRDALPRLEALAQGAPSARKAMAQGLVAAWKLSLDGKGAAPGGSDAWSRLAMAHRNLVLGQAGEAAKVLDGLRRQADPSEAWAADFWRVQLEADRMAGAGDQARAHLADYKERFKGRSLDASLDKLVEGI
ncbi:MAG TPA: hypothetical protein VJ623_09495 [Holophagaceae bacterium]|nr:hypothetical protein [Holophagaceae bacterium]HJW32253.1 hypothetical protein [Holophagaceae bacterium]